MSFPIEILIAIGLEAAIIFILFYPGGESFFNPVRQFLFCLASALLLLAAQFFISTRSASFVVPTSEIIRNGTAPLKRFFAKRGLMSQALESDFIRDNFILVDVSYDMVLTPHNSERNVQVDRGELNQLYQMLYKNRDEFSFVVSDIYVQDLDKPENHTDSLLIDTIDRLGNAKKIIQAVTDVSDDSYTHLRDRGIPVGMVDSDMGGGFLHRADLRIDERVKYLPYEMLLRTENAGSTDQDGLPPPEPGVVPALPAPVQLIDGEQLSVHYTRPWKLSILKKVFTPQFFFIEPADLNPEKLMIVFLKDIANDEGLLKEQLQRFKNRDKKPIIVVGTFRGAFDLHRTTYGDLHGGFVLLNIFYNLHKHYNYLSVKYLFFVLAGFFIVFYSGLINTLLGHSVDIPGKAARSTLLYGILLRRLQKIVETAREETARPRNQVLAYCLNIPFIILLVVIQNFQYLLLILIVAFSDFYYNQSLNVLSLAGLVYASNGFLKTLLFITRKPLGESPVDPGNAAVSYAKVQE
ncbi:hypothetical protein GCM10023091_36240 [Ravibacter arvi]|uniref:CHASE2 domain-containing protein n=1 Tax=Ravibacter arvi TaxID=2051041 RepID=A0ABP8M850_9BACT